MRIVEFDDQSSTAPKLVALSQFLLARADDTNAKKSISTQTFLKLAQNQGISLTTDQLKDLVQRPPLNNLIQDVRGDDASGEVVFKGDEQVTDTMTVDQARQTVDSMAKNATKRAI